ncbi:hypothetical protein [Cohnella rhizosphaerae]|uniref:Uncharacterized protein n=1 Tax=Cohnella rhizosphaerae TaxID=1457232 RepID=A0A9X4QR09_9BACL|nr:hypothetical protein [Cohnella rhizosphaerae]MDG0808556.1 hypothetical protein [Cohnella rhizosphaerae]
MALGTYPGPGISRVADREAALLYFYWSGAGGKRGFPDRSQVEKESGGAS